MSSGAVGQRLKQERERLGHSQTAMAEFAGVTKKSQIRYESGESSATAEYLAAASNAGADVAYILSGIRSVTRPGMSTEEIDLFNEIVDTFWSLADDDRRALLRQGRALHLSELETAGRSRGTVTQTFNSSVGQVAGRDIVNKGKRK